MPTTYRGRFPITPTGGWVGQRVRIIQHNLSVGRSETCGGEMKLRACKSDAFTVRRPFPTMRWAPGVIELPLESGERPELAP